MSIKDKPENEGLITTTHNCNDKVFTKTNERHFRSTSLNSLRAVEDIMYRVVKKQRYSKSTVSAMQTRQKRLKSALNPRLKKAQFLNLLKGEPFDFLKIQTVAKYFKKIKGGLFGDIEMFEKKTKNENFETVSQCQKLEEGLSLGFLKLQFAAEYQKS